MKIEDLLSTGNPPRGPQKKKESPLKSLQADLDFYSESLKEIATEVIREGVSEYPIFLAHQHELNLGELIIDRTELGTQWTVHASTLEEFVEKGVIKQDKQEHFKRNFKDPEQFMCVFVVVPEGANFVFYPYQPKGQ